MNMKKSRGAIYNIGEIRGYSSLSSEERVVYSVPSSHPTSTPPEFSVFIPYCRARDQNPRLWLASIWLTGLIWLTPWLTWLRVTKILVYDWPIWRAFRASAGERPGFVKSRNLPISKRYFCEMRLRRCPPEPRRAAPRLWRTPSKPHRAKITDLSSIWAPYTSSSFSLTF